MAERLGEKPTKLYHHVEALERVGLIRLARTRQKRGTLEKYYIAVARQFRTDSRLFSAAKARSGDQQDALLATISTVFDRTADEMRRLAVQQGCRKGIQEQGVLSYLEVRTDREHARALQARLMKLLKSLEGPKTAAKTKAAERRYRLTLAFYPIDPDA